MVADFITGFEKYLQYIMPVELSRYFAQTITCARESYAPNEQDKQKQQKTLIQYTICIENLWFIVLWYPGELTFFLPIQRIDFSDILTFALSNILFCGPFCRYEQKISDIDYVIYEWCVYPKEKLKELHEQNVKNLTKFRFSYQN